MTCNLVYRRTGNFYSSNLNGSNHSISKYFCVLSADVDECASTPCLNGATCEDLVLDYNCTCALGFTGKKCDMSKAIVN